MIVCCSARIKFAKAHAVPFSHRNKRETHNCPGISNTGGWNHIKFRTNVVIMQCLNDIGCRNCVVVSWNASTPAAISSANLVSATDVIDEEAARHYEENVPQKSALKESTPILMLYLAVLVIINLRHCRGTCSACCSRCRSRFSHRRIESSCRSFSVTVILHRHHKAPFDVAIPVCTRCKSCIALRTPS